MTKLRRTVLVSAGSLACAAAIGLAAAGPAFASVSFSTFFSGGWDSPSWTFQPQSEIKLHVAGTCDGGTMTVTLYHEMSFSDQPVGGSPTFPCDGQYHDFIWDVQGGSDNHYHLHFDEHHGNGPNQANVEGTFGEDGNTAS